MPEFNDTEFNAAEFNAPEPASGQVWTASYNAFFGQGGIGGGTL
jgi:hypothetical protein